MGSGGESKPSNLYDPFSASQSLLSGPDDENYPPINYQHGPRPLRDLPALLFFLLLSLYPIALGLVAVARRNPAASRVSSFVFDPATSSCVLSSSNSLSFASSSPFLNDLSWTLVVTLLLAGPIALAVLWLCRHYAKQVVYAALPFFILIPAFVNVYWFAACALSHSCRHSFPLAYRILALIFIFLLIAIVLWIIVANWHRVELTVRIVRIVAAALAGNMSLLAVLLALGLGLLVYFTSVVVFLVFSTWNGKVVPKEEEGTGGEYYLCVWRQDGWVPAYFALAIITMVWSVAVMVEAQVYVISGTIAQWYFSNEGSKPSRSIRSSLRDKGEVCKQEVHEVYVLLPVSRNHRVFLINRTPLVV
ncbi:putative CTL-like protein [Cocos nucifera]|uniref:Choline transporter-like protein n=1 Tax=Cocos nucifera TaxID=13894 RepID=A0A8K0N7V6_COCNU|nr:putative CTL-like protein [Cocos nucifera]